MNVIKGVKKYLLFAGVILSVITSGCGGANKLSSSGEKDDRKLLEQAEQLYNRKKYTKALQILDKIRYTTSVVADDAHLLTAKVYIGQHEYALAASELKWLIGQYPNSDKQEEASYLLGEAYRLAAPRPELDQEYTKKAISAFQDFMDRFPSSELADSAGRKIELCREKLAKKIYLSAELYYKMHRDSAALIYINQIRKEYNDTQWKYWADYLEALIRIRQGKNDAAKMLLEGIIARCTEDEKLTRKASKKLKKIQ